MDIRRQTQNATRFVPIQPNGPVGGALGSGGSLRTGGSLGTGGSVHKSVKHMYHHLLDMPHRSWEHMREAASQTMGNQPSKMWGRLHTRPYAGARKHLEDIAHIHTPHLAAKMLEAEHTEHGEGGGFYDAVSHIWQSVRDGAKSVGSFLGDAVGLASDVHGAGSALGVF